MGLNSAGEGSRITLLPPISTSDINGCHLATEVDISGTGTNLATRAKQQWVKLSFGSKRSPVVYPENRLGESQRRVCRFNLCSHFQGNGGRWRQPTQTAIFDNTSPNAAPMGSQIAPLIRSPMDSVQALSLSPSRCPSGSAWWRMRVKWGTPGVKLDCGEKRPKRKQINLEMCVCRWNSGI